MRNVESDYKAAYLADHDLLRRSGNTTAAAKVAAILKNEFGVDVAADDKTPPAKKAPARGRRGAKETAAADPAPETAVE